LSTEPRRVVLAAAEAVPFVKSGGLADVISALAAELARSGRDVTLILPAYAQIDRDRFGFAPLGGAALHIPIGNRREPLHLLQGQLPAEPVRVLLLDHPGYFGRPGIYLDPQTGQEYPDAAERYIFLSRAVLAALTVLGAPPDVLHLNDHHVALAAAYRYTGQDVPPGFLRQTAIVFGIHNLAYQGVYPPDHFALTGLPESLMRPLGPLEFWGRMNFMKAGLVFSDALVTVSPTYAREIQSDPALGCGLEGVLRERGSDLHGILNGIDTRVWDPEHDLQLPARFSRDQLEGKAVCKRELQQRCGFEPAPHTPLFGMISRFVEQKGIDLVLEAMDTLLQWPLQLVMLGQGESQHEARLRDLARSHSDRLSVHVGFDDRLAHEIEAGCDFFLMPSRYEPCGLNQMYSMRYGTVPVVRTTGGLSDTVIDWDPQSLSGTGFVFGRYAADALFEAVRRALAAYGDAMAMQRLIAAGMQADFSWANSARRYLEVYGNALQRRRAHAGTPGAFSGSWRGH
jgi:starch synthase